KKQKKRSLLCGTSEYQAAWIVEDSDVSGDCRKFGLEDDQASLKLRDSNVETNAEPLQVGDYH
ncbi:hypothetical protein Tco_1374114, partial [Tanacetum coccineum]